MSALRLINETITSSDVSSITIDDVFSADFDIYFFTLSEVKSADTNENVLGIRMVNTSGSADSGSNYDRAHLTMRMYDTFQEGKSTGITYMNTINVGANTTSGGAISGYFFNPYNNSSYTFNIWQSTNNRGGGNISRKGINVHKVVQSNSGFQIVNAGSTSFESGMIIRTYGLRVDS